MTEEYLVRSNDRYFPLSPGTFPERSVEAFIAENLATIFPDYVGAVCKPRFFTPAGNVEPDIILVKRDFSGWALVEVEDETHSVNGHILPQLTCLRFAKAESTTAQAFKDAYSGEISDDDLEKSLEVNPEVFLVIHGSSKEFREVLDKDGVRVIEVEIAQSRRIAGEYILSISAEGQQFMDGEGTAKRPYRHMPQIWQVRGVAVEKLIADGNLSLIEVVFNETPSLWSVQRCDDGVLLRSPSNLRIDEGIVQAGVRIQKGTGIVYMIPELISQ